MTQIDALQNGEFIASGTFTETSSTGSVAPYQARLEHISVSPNPTTGQAVLQFTIARATTLRIMLLDAAQGCMKAIQPAAWTPPGTHTRSFDISQLPAGTYYVALEGAGGVSVLPLIKI